MFRTISTLTSLTSLVYSPSLRSALEIVSLVGSDIHSATMLETRDSPFSNYTVSNKDRLWM